MKCPYCGSEHNNIIDSRDVGQNRRRRRYICYSCEKRFTTYEYLFVDAVRYEELLHREHERENAFKKIIEIAKMEVNHETDRCRQTN